MDAVFSVWLMRCVQKKRISKVWIRVTFYYYYFYYFFFSQFVLRLCGSTLLLHLPACSLCVQTWVSWHFAWNQTTCFQLLQSPWLWTHRASIALCPSTCTMLSPMPELKPPDRAPFHPTVWRIITSRSRSIKLHFLSLSFFFPSNISSQH